jgi:hypothetical protein
LEKACKEIIETILICLPDAYKGTIYYIGSPPDLTATRVTSGVINKQRNRISWGLPEESEYNPPGKAWKDYRDQRDRPLEAMGWCVERQKSWTSENPSTDIRSVRLQTEGIKEDFHHMEPVLLPKSDLYPDLHAAPAYPRNEEGDILWDGMAYVVVAVIKIHFRPHTIKMGSHQTAVIKKLSRSLGTELLSYHIRRDSMQAMQQLAHDRLAACNILADSLRNAITKSGLLFSLIKQELGTLREQWEAELVRELNGRNLKLESIKNLNQLLSVMGNDHKELRDDLIGVQQRFLELSLPPEKGEHWVTMQVETRWRNLLQHYPQDNQLSNQVWKTIDRLKKSLHFGKDPEVLACYDKIPEGVKREWVFLIYGNNNRFDAGSLERLIEILGEPVINIPAREKTRKSLIQLKALAEIMNNLERNTNFVLRQVLNGNEKGPVSNAGVTYTPE